MNIIKTSKIHEDIKHKYARAKTQLLYRNPFFGSLMLQCHHIWTDDIPTMATDGKDLFFNPEFVKTLSVEELQGVLVHELCHKMYLHRLRAEKYVKPDRYGRVTDSKDQEKLRRWNISCDYAINPIIIESGCVLPADSLLDDQYKNMLAEEIYEKLPKEQAQEGQPNHLVFGGALTDEGARELEREVKLQMSAAATLSKQHGDLPDSIKRLLEENSKSKVDWRATLAAFIEESIMGDDDITFKRPNRRMLAHDLYLPTTEGIQVPPISIMFDTSGSIYSYPEVVEQFMAEIRSITEHMLPEATHVICNDTKVQSHDIYERGEEMVLELTGGGGTDFTEVFKYIQEMEAYSPKVNIVFTDLYFNYSNLEPSVPTLWITYGSDVNSEEPPFGQVIHIE